MCDFDRFSQIQSHMHTHYTIINIQMKATCSSAVVVLSLAVPCDPLFSNIQTDTNICDWIWENQPFLNFIVLRNIIFKIRVHCSYV